METIESAPERVRAAAFDRGSIERYRELVEPLQVTLQALLGEGRVGEMFSRQSTVGLDLDRPAVFDVSSIPEDETELVGAALSACWGVGFGAVNVTHALAEAGLAPMRHYLIILDELWRALIAGRGMVDRTNSLTRLNRQWGVGVVMCSHTIKDLLSLPDEHERMKALGLIERSGMLICGALPPEEMPRLALAKDLSVAEQRQLISWQDPPAWSAAATQRRAARTRELHDQDRRAARDPIPGHAHQSRAGAARHQQALARAKPPRRAFADATRPRGRTGGRSSGWRQADGTRPGPRQLSPLLTGTLALVALAAVAGEAAAQGGAAIDHWRHRPPVDPLALVLELADGRTRWPTAGTPILIAAAGVCALIVSAVVLARVRRPATGADRAARLLGTGRSVHPVSLGNAQATAKRFGVEQPGLPIARAVAGGQTLYATWEDMQCDIWGPRKGKSSSRAIPTLLAAPGAAFATSNKPDLYAATRGGPRAARAGVELRPRGRSPPASRTGGGTRSATSRPTAARWS